MIEAFYGPDFLPLGILMDQLGSYLVLSTAGVVVAAISSTRAETVLPGAIVRRVLAFPPFQAMVLATALMPFALPDVALAVLDRLGGTLVPLALVSVGFQLRLADTKGLSRELTAGLGFKLLLGPAVVAALFLGVFGLSGRVGEVAVFEAAMGPMIGGSVVAIQHGLNPRLVTLMVGIGIPLSLATAAGWWWLLLQ
jgi:predicted permease